MDEEAVQLRTRFSRLTDEELRRVVTTERTAYRRVALELAAAEMSRRGLPVPRGADVFKDREAVEEPDEEATARKSFFVRERLIEEGMAVMYVLVPLAVAYVVGWLVKPGHLGLFVLLSLVSYAVFGFIIRAAWQEFSPASFEAARAEEEQEELREAQAETLRAELREAAEDALDELGLEWQVGDVYRDSYGYHLDFYDSHARLRSIVFEGPPVAGADWFARELARRLRALPDEPPPPRLPFPTSQSLE